jgi:hypothetical protein
MSPVDWYIWYLYFLSYYEIYVYVQMVLVTNTVNRFL